MSSYPWSSENNVFVLLKPGTHCAPHIGASGAQTDSSLAQGKPVREGSCWHLKTGRAGPQSGKPEDQQEQVACPGPLATDLEGSLMGSFLLEKRAQGVDLVGNPCPQRLPAGCMPFGQRQLHERVTGLP